jgi:hypothetical protein
MKIFKVYGAHSPSNKWYIGITFQSLEKRIQQHFTAAKNGSPYKFHRALSKYGKTITWTQLCEAQTLESAKECERDLIEIFDCLKKGYNSTLGGDGGFGRISTQESRTRLAKARGTEPFVVLDKRTGELKGKWVNTSECARDLNCDQPSVSRVLRGKAKTHKGLLFIKEKDFSHGK